MDDLRPVWDESDVLDTLGKEWGEQVLADATSRKNLEKRLAETTPRTHRPLVINRTMRALDEFSNNFRRKRVRP